jgi:hypothetical protein
MPMSYVATRMQAVGWARLTHAIEIRMAAVLNRKQIQVHHENKQMPVDL